jgi:hypothetical protein
MTASRILVNVMPMKCLDIYDIIEAEDEDGDEGDDSDRPKVEDLNDIDEDESTSSLPPPPSVAVKNDIQVKEDVGQVAMDKEQEAEEFAKEIRRAESIVETYRDVKVYPLLGAPADLLKKSKFANKFDAMFVSTRGAQFVGTPTANDILKKDALVALETGE